MSAIPKPSLRLGFLSALSFWQRAEAAYFDRRHKDHLAQRYFPGGRIYEQGVTALGEDPGPNECVFFTLPPTLFGMHAIVRAWKSSDGVRVEDIGFARSHEVAGSIIEALRAKWESVK